MIDANLKISIYVSSIIVARTVFNKGYYDDFRVYKGAIEIKIM